MNKVLIINASVRKERSHSRKLTELFKDNWKKKNPNDQFTYREVGLEEIPPINEKWIASAFISPKERTNENQTGVELSNALIKEFKEHNVYVLGTPMYNWSIPSGLKSYIDQIMRINETWKFRSGKPDGDYVGLLENKKMFILSSRGDTGYGENEKNEHMNFQTTYLKFVFGIMGIKDISIISLDNEEFGGEIFENSKKEIYQKIQNI
ncbi:MULTISPECIES: FMN-dependent NADH-azoreductase [Flavobacteriaceae]|jgi:FMN-dependent NADH-azoreductase|uniref:FMN dependent NADH:quinone oxidoreductase n=1 Tax=Flagellimonas marinaquae TaxID=254955 RepID=A0AA48HCL3_9FLAO|nr:MULTISPECIES: NAD(P)H-dependent oxidoreductase [Allomuricauda]MCA0958264.1 NAD(P)H-dependent oxidoreductase [Allomuricauda ruestringensis]BDW92770.1 FMN-dependent NADH-azoreductase 1 [Allomuricauda aquimarina]